MKNSLYSKILMFGLAFLGYTNKVFSEVNIRTTAPRIQAALIYEGKTPQVTLITSKKPLITQQMPLAILLRRDHGAYPQAPWHLFPLNIFGFVVSDIKINSFSKKPQLALLKIDSVVNGMRDRDEVCLLPRPDAPSIGCESLPIVVGPLSNIVQNFIRFRNLARIPVSTTQPELTSWAGELDALIPLLGGKIPEYWRSAESVETMAPEEFGEYRTTLSKEKMESLHPGFEELFEVSEPATEEEVVITEVPTVAQRGSLSLLNEDIPIGWIQIVQEGEEPQFGVPYSYELPDDQKHLWMLSIPDINKEVTLIISRSDSAVFFKTLLKKVLPPYAIKVKSAVQDNLLARDFINDLDIAKKMELEYGERDRRALEGLKAKIKSEQERQVLINRANEAFEREKQMKEKPVGPAQLIELPTSAQTEEEIRRAEEARQQRIDKIAADLMAGQEEADRIALKKTEEVFKKEYQDYLRAAIEYEDIDKELDEIKEKGFEGAAGYDEYEKKSEKLFNARQALDAAAEKVRYRESVLRAMKLLQQQ